MSNFKIHVQIATDLNFSNVILNTVVERPTTHLTDNELEQLIPDEKYYGVLLYSRARFGGEHVISGGWSTTRTFKTTKATWTFRHLNPIMWFDISKENTVVTGLDNRVVDKVQDLVNPNLYMRRSNDSGNDATFYNTPDYIARQKCLHFTGNRMLMIPPIIPRSVVMVVRDFFGDYGTFLGTRYNTYGKGFRFSSNGSRQINHHYNNQGMEANFPNGLVSINGEPSNNLTGLPNSSDNIKPVVFILNFSATNDRERTEHNVLTQLGMFRTNNDYRRYEYPAVFYLHEIIFFDTEINLHVGKKIAGELHHKWKALLPDLGFTDTLYPDHPYKNNPPSIGEEWNPHDIPNVGIICDVNKAKVSDGGTNKAKLHDTADPRIWWEFDNRETVANQPNKYYTKVETNKKGVKELVLESRLSSAVINDSGDHGGYQPHQNIRIANHFYYLGTDSTTVLIGRNIRGGNTTNAPNYYNRVIMGSLGGGPDFGKHLMLKEGDALKQLTIDPPVTLKSDDPFCLSLYRRFTYTSDDHVDNKKDKIYINNRTLPYLEEKNEVLDNSGFNHGFNNSITLGSNSVGPNKSDAEETVNGKFSFIMMVRNEISKDDMDRLMGWARIKKGVKLPEDHPYFDKSPTYPEVEEFIPTYNQHRDFITRYDYRPYPCINQFMFCNIDGYSGRFEVFEYSVGNTKVNADEYLKLPNSKDWIKIRKDGYLIIRQDSSKNTVYPDEDTVKFKIRDNELKETFYLNVLFCSRSYATEAMSSAAGQYFNQQIPNVSLRCWLNEGTTANVRNYVNNVAFSFRPPWAPASDGPWSNSRGCLVINRNNQIQNTDSRTNILNPLRVGVDAYDLSFFIRFVDTDWKQMATVFALWSSNQIQVDYYIGEKGRKRSVFVQPSIAVQMNNYIVRSENPYVNDVNKYVPGEISFFDGLNNPTFGVSTRGAYICDGTWHHLLFRRTNNRVLEIYVDGELNNSHTMPAQINHSIYNYNYIAIGNYSFSAIGAMSTVILRKGNITDDDLTKHFYYARSRARQNRSYQYTPISIGGNQTHYKSYLSEYNENVYTSFPSVNENIVVDLQYPGTKVDNTKTKSELSKVKTKIEGTPISVVPGTGSNAMSDYLGDSIDNDWFTGSHTACIYYYQTYLTAHYKGSKVAAQLIYITGSNLPLLDKRGRLYCDMLTDLAYGSNGFNITAYWPLGNVNRSRIADVGGLDKKVSDLAVDKDHGTLQAHLTLDSRVKAECIDVADTEIGKCYDTKALNDNAYIILTGNVKDKPKLHFGKDDFNIYFFLRVGRRDKLLQPFILRDETSRKGIEIRFNSNDTPGLTSFILDGNIRKRLDINDLVPDGDNHYHLFRFSKLTRDDKDVLEIQMDCKDPVSLDIGPKGSIVLPPPTTMRITTIGGIGRMMITRHGKEVTDPVDLWTRNMNFNQFKLYDYSMLRCWHDPLVPKDS